MTQFVLDYTLWAFACALAVLQAAAAWSGLSGLLFFRRWPAGTLRVSLAIIVLAYFWFFASAERNQPDTGLGLDGPTQSQWFAVAAGAAFLLTLVLSSIVNHRWGRAHGWDPVEDRCSLLGAEWLRRTTFARALAARARALLRSAR